MFSCAGNIRTHPDEGQHLLIGPIRGTNCQNVAEEWLAIAINTSGQQRYTNARRRSAPRCRKNVEVHPEIFRAKYFARKTGSFGAQTKGAESEFH